ncbi:hypothetical protein HNR60_002617 [Rhodopseudomonas rhenobacensis]|uniref:Uncharacterized protein n=1 Tax=Rhodopseudomonas rhenobacensis TaxID=87461 RepID=A0A7W7Z4H9_9BRAD|nr:hypothetical protein [Rhodopseudomonas rhenobacensis]
MNMILNTHRNGVQTVLAISLAAACVVNLIVLWTLL